MPNEAFRASLASVVAMLEDGELPPTDAAVAAAERYLADNPDPRTPRVGLLGEGSLLLEWRTQTATRIVTCLWDGTHREYERALPVGIKAMPDAKPRLSWTKPVADRLDDTDPVNCMTWAAIAFLIVALIAAVCTFVG
jgi:hypothetical protein